MLEYAYGQMVSVQKSSVFFSTNNIVSDRMQLCQKLQMSEADGGCTYLGLPNMLSRNKSVVLGFLKDKVKNRVQV